MSIIKNTEELNNLLDAVQKLPVKKDEQEKVVDITENGTTVVTPDEGMTLGGVTVNVEVESGGLPDWDDDSPIIATGEGYPVNAPKTWWDLTEKGTFRWHSRSTNTTASVGAVAFDLIPDNYKAICEKILQIDVEESVGSAYTVFAPNCERVRLPASVTNWNSYGLLSLKEVDMSRTSIKTSLEQMFSTQGVVTELILPETFELVPYKCFSGSPIQKINLGSIKQFNISCFENCYYLKGSITFSQSLIQIYNNAFANTGLEEIKFRQSVGNNPIIANNAFSNCKNLFNIYVPWSEGEVDNAPWGATNATIHYNTTYDENGNPIEAEV